MSSASIRSAMENAATFLAVAEDTEIDVEKRTDVLLHALVYAVLAIAAAELDVVEGMHRGSTK
jgi:hypothetical protein